jgi:hypothetical protein
VCTGHFAECNTRQRGALPSVSTIALDKEPRPGHQYRFFAECNGSGTRQRSTLCRVPYQALGKVPDMGTSLADSLPSVMALALGKEARFVECHTRHSAKYLTWGPLWRILYRVLSGRHSTKGTPLPSVAWDNRQRLCLRHPSP